MVAAMICHREGRLRRGGTAAIPLVMAVILLETFIGGVDNSHLIS